MSRILMFLPPVLFLGLAALFVVGMNRDDPDNLPSAFTGKIAPAVTVASLADHPLFTDEDLRAPGVKLVNFWASWCAPCRAEHPMLEKLSDEGIAIYGVNYKDRAEAAEGFLAEMGNPYRAIGTDERTMSIDWGITGVPETFVINGEGRIILRFAGPITAAELARSIRPAIVEASK
ncbi:DsbE family thiol:disulfide interchange protein [Pseudorhodobacter turbinis]|uniref:DsbE family thiol:disulfide interchange protein n=1 Tax=Pseudorhodobacter turbinis TaxID=2500533 RepID=A0A4P8EDL0_9RHOB|nr:DsbE family thiol:disulfide interchange protein [Pseudorhodobacter turbinis]QCO55051.1 DsbE family thiol:disulfide interchange protein [Pseudorhodobacter turbinis]